VLSNWVLCYWGNLERIIVELRLFFLLSSGHFWSAARIVSYIHGQLRKCTLGSNIKEKSQLYIFFSSGVVPGQTHTVLLFSSHAFHLPLGKPSSSNVRTTPHSSPFLSPWWTEYLCSGVRPENSPSRKKIIFLNMFNKMSN
jgi:hypothetical protein